ncbi:hypothetical protein C7534_104133 [Pseudomonas sp. OV226]|nr:hypothetical protein C7534_104133 [Pseudomonas sp. OV226]
MDALRPLRDVTQSVTGCITTQSVGTIGGGRYFFINAEQAALNASC